MNRPARWVVLDALRCTATVFYHIPALLPEAGLNAERKSAGPGRRARVPAHVFPNTMLRPADAVAMSAPLPWVSTSPTVRVSCLHALGGTPASQRRLFDVSAS